MLAGPVELGCTKKPGSGDFDAVKGPSVWYLSDSPSMKLASHQAPSCPTLHAYTKLRDNRVKKHIAHFQSGLFSTSRLRRVILSTVMPTRGHTKSQREMQQFYGCRTISGVSDRACASRVGLKGSNFLFYIVDT